MKNFKPQKAQRAQKMRMVLNRLLEGVAKRLHAIAILPRSETRRYIAVPASIDSRANFAVSNDGDDFGQDSEITAIANADGEASLKGDGWVRLAKFGTYPLGDKWIQDFGRAQSNEIVRRFKGAVAKFANKIFGSGDKPVYQGHPDDPTFAERGHDDHTQYGRITDMETRQDGLWIKREWSDLGQQLVNSGRYFFSPRWNVRAVSQEGSKTRIHPYKLISAGLTPHPNIPGSVANAGELDPTTTPNDKMKKYLTMLLSKLGFSAEQIDAVSNGTDDAPGLEEVQGKVDVLTEAQKELNNAKQELATANAALEAEKTSHESTRTALATANAAVETERKERSDLVVGKAIANGKVAEADREKEVTALCNAEDFKAAANELQERENVLPNGGKTDDLGNRKTEISDAANAAKAFQKGLGEFAVINGYNLNADYENTYAKFMATEDGKKLFKATRETDAE